MSIANRLIQRLQKLPDKTQAGLARALGVTRSAITQLKKGDTKDLKMDNLIAAADYLNCEIRWLATGRGPEERRFPDDQMKLNEIYGRLDPQKQSALLVVAETLSGDLPTCNVCEYECRSAQTAR